MGSGLSPSASPGMTGKPHARPHTNRRRRPRRHRAGARPAPRARTARLGARLRRRARPRQSRGVDAGGGDRAVPIVPLAELPEHADLAVEAAPAAVLEAICRPMLEAGKSVMVLSAGALLPRPELIALAKERGGQIVVPTGALIGLDAVTAAAEGTIHAVRMTTRKPPKGLIGAPYLEANGISVEGLNAAKRVFSGTAREAAAGFPGKRQRRGGAVARRHRPRPHHDRHLGRPRRHAQLPHHRGRVGFGDVLDDDREHPLREPENRPYHGPLRPRRAAEDARAVAGGDLGLRLVRPSSQAPHPEVLARSASLEGRNPADAAPRPRLRASRLGLWPRTSA